MKNKKVPMRMCMACRERKEKRELIRVVRDGENHVSLDPTGKKAGRGAYICADAACLERAVKTRALERALETPIDGAIYDALKEELAQVGE